MKKLLKAILCFEKETTDSVPAGVYLRSIELLALQVVSGIFYWRLFKLKLNFKICGTECPHACTTCELDEQKLTVTCSKCNDEFTVAPSHTADIDICFRKYTYFSQCEN